MSLKSMAYDNPAYISRGSYTGVVPAGTGATTGLTAKFVAFANLLLFGLTVVTTTAGTSTYTGGLVGGPSGVVAATGVAVAADQLNLLRITNTAAVGATVALSTSTIGPFTVGGSFLGAGGTATNQAGGSNQFALNTTAGTAGFGGLAINQGDQFWIQRGTDATAVESVIIDYQVVPGASVTA